MIALLAAPFAPLAAYAIALVVAYAWRRRRYPEGRRPRAAELCLLIVSEALAQWRMLGWSLARKGRSLPRRAGSPVLLVHGFSADGHSLWILRAALDRAGRRTLAPHLGRPGRPIAAYADALIAVLEAEAPGELDVVCHSLGGVCLLEALRRRPELGVCFRRAVFVASPIAGTKSLPALLPLPEAKELALGSAFVRALPDPAAALPRARLTTLATAFDVMIYPIENTRIAGATAHEMDNVGHAALVVDRRAVRFVLAALEEPA